MKAFKVDSLTELQNHLSLQYRMFQPIVDQSEQWHWRQVDSSESVPLLQRPEQTQFSPKSFFFREREDVFTFDGESFEPIVPDESPFVLFGVSACDLTAIAYHDEFFKDDSHYQTRRKKALLVGMDCNKVCKNGFCPTVNSGPIVDFEHADIVLFDASEIDASKIDGNKWWVIVASEQGELALTGLTLAPAFEGWLNKREQQRIKAVKEFDEPDYMGKGIEKINDDSIPQTFWEELGTQCLSCSGCTSVCPTCSCYSVEDLAGNDQSVKNLVTDADLSTDESKITRSRFWDSCLYEGFQKEASGHNPGKSPGTRVHRFWDHKFSNQFAKRFNRYTCVGCGRCEQVCPGVIGVHSVMKRIAKL